ncbi:uncharacterized protein LOC117115702 [Anneissia japonica]|uniref:uncharacterized protein LOC117115702 n=1 Tax=Anneissia japonica TaxID=1529436 RepID=UPI0014259E0C|nr:uncharacterized protein LOC117115702 [Anneissia japonica]
MYYPHSGEEDDMVYIGPPRKRKHSETSSEQGDAHKDHTYMIPRDVDPSLVDHFDYVMRPAKDRESLKKKHKKSKHVKGKEKKKNELGPVENELGQLTLLIGFNWNFYFGYKCLSLPFQNTDDEEAELSIYCVSCGLPVNLTRAIRHFQRCFSKLESQTSYGSAYPTRIAGESMFCDYFNTQQNTYCKRLKVLCPEHTKDPKVSDDEVCGCPLTEGNILKETDQVCRMAKKKCNKHFHWEKLRRAEIDLQRVHWWLKLDDFIEQERTIRTAMSDRAGVLGLVLHQTIDHDMLAQVHLQSGFNPAMNPQMNMGMSLATGGPAGTDVNPGDEVEGGQTELPVAALPVGVAQTA